MLWNLEENPKLEMEKIDIWAVGILLFEMCVGKNPFTLIEDL